jgi:molybdenum cofactor biosynthesis protein MoaC
MRDVSRKSSSLRSARAAATVTASPATIQLIRDGRVPKGDPLAVARVAGIQAAKNCSQLIPYCHPLPIDYAAVNFDLRDAAIVITTEVRAVYKTGVEMEALAAAAVAALTVYDMLKMVDEDLRIESIELLEKRGGKSSFAKVDNQNLRCAVLVLSDSVAAGSNTDESGLLIRQRLEDEGLKVNDYSVISDELSGISERLKHYADVEGFDLVLTTGGTGLGPRDNTPEAMREVIEREVRGISEALRLHGLLRNPNSMLGRGVAGIRGQTVIVNLPGSPRAVTESLDALFPAIHHAFAMIRGEGHTYQQQDSGARS